MNFGVPTNAIIAEIFVLFFGIGLHEYAHCKFADMAGDPTPRYYGRVTLNLFKHFEPVGTMMMIVTSLAGYGIGWGRPAPINPAKMHHPRLDTFVAVAAGPVSNILQAIVYGALLRVLYNPLTTTEDPIAIQVFLILYFGVAINLGLATFNLIPFGPLDGHWLVGELLPDKPRYHWYKFNRSVGFAGLFVVVILLQVFHIPLTAGPVSYGFKLLTGHDLY